MARKKKEPEIYAEVVDVITKITDYQIFTWDELFDVAKRWCEKDYKNHVTVAAKISVTPGAVLLAALLYVSHPLIVSPSRGPMYGFLKCQAEIIMAQLEERNLPIPIKRDTTILFASQPQEKN